MARFLSSFGSMPRKRDASPIRRNNIMVKNKRNDADWMASPLLLFALIFWLPAHKFTELGFIFFSQSIFITSGVPGATG